MKLEIKDVYPEHSKKIQDLSKKAFGNSTNEINTKSFFNWMFFENLYKKNYSRVIDNGENFLAHWGFVPISCTVHKNQLSGALSLHLVSDNSILGVAGLLWRKIIKDFESHNIKLYFTIINENSRSMLEVLGWDVIKNPVLIKIFRPFLTFHDLLLNKFDDSLLIRNMKPVFNFFDTIFLLFFKKKIKNYPM